MTPLELMQAIADGAVPPPPIGRTLGMRLTEVEPGRAVFELEVDPERHGNPMGTLHGGVLCDLADAAMGCAYYATLAEGEAFTTLDLNISFRRPVWSGLLTATARVVDGGRTVGLADCEIRDASDRLIAYSTSTCMTLRGEAAKGRVAPS